MTIILLIAIIALVIFWLVNKKKLEATVKDLRIQLSTKEKEKTELSELVSRLQEKNSALLKYKGIIDIEEKIKEMLAEANTEAELIISKAKQKFDRVKLEADELKVQAETIIKDAEKKAQDISADAIIILQKTDGLEKTAKAMKNIIEGYGDTYLIPTYSLLDDLADEFGYTEAGEKLKIARETTRLMIKNGAAATCQYVETSRKEIAMNFVIDAFNGKVDSILSKVKKDNFGTLEQKIKDAYHVVNNNGTAFRDAAITQLYLKARIDELKWAVIAQELKWEEQEEQRRIKEQIREEEKARKEFEKASRDAQKEEETLKKLIEKAQKEVSAANDEQKVKYEERLIELEGKLKIAEDKNQRAISMAQQTKSGNVYIISNIGSFGENVYKIGMTRRLEPLDRVKELGDASVPFEFDVHSMIYSENAPGLERELHKKFLRLQMNKVNPRKEFFKVKLEDIKTEIERMNINAKWTLIAEARHYRESLAIEDEIKHDVQKQAEWEKRQLQIDPVTLETEEEIDA